nr:MAG: hypothetical protein [Microvirus sp.]
MTDADKALLICLADCVNLAETTESEIIYMEMIIDLLSMYTTKKEKTNGTK